MTDTTLAIKGTPFGDITLTLADPGPGSVPTKFTLTFGKGVGLPLLVNRVAYHGAITLVKIDIGWRISRNAIYRDDSRGEPTLAALNTLSLMAIDFLPTWLDSPDGKAILARFGRRNLPVVPL